MLPVFFDDTILEKRPIEAEREPIKGCLQLSPPAKLSKYKCAHSGKKDKLDLWFRVWEVASFQTKVSPMDTENQNFSLILQKGLRKKETEPYKLYQRELLF